MITFDASIKHNERFIISRTLNEMVYYNILAEYITSNNNNTKIHIYRGIHENLYDVYGRFHFNIKLYKYGITDDIMYHVYVTPTIMGYLFEDIYNIEHYNEHLINFHFIQIT